MDYKIPDFLAHPPVRSPETAARIKKEIEIEEEYNRLFGGTCCSTEARIMMPEDWTKYYKDMATCVEKGKPLEELYPEWDDTGLADDPDTYI